MSVWIHRNPQHQCVVTIVCSNVHQTEKERHGPTSCRTFTRIRTDQFVKNVNSTLCVVVVGYDFWLVLIISHDRVVSVLGRHQHNSFFSYTSKTASDVTEAMRLEQEAVLLYLSVTACDHCFRISHRRSQMTGRDFSHVGEVTTRLSVYHGTHVISCRYGRCYLPRQSVSVSLHPTALTTPV